MNLQEFRHIVDRTPAGITALKNDTAALYAYVGLESHCSYQNRAVSKALFERMSRAFTSGQGEAWRTCKMLKTDLIREHIIKGARLDPYFEVLRQLEDALRGDGSGQIVGDWPVAIKAARDHIAITNFTTVNHRQIYSREFAVAEAAKFLDQQGYDIRLKPGFISLERRAERSLRRKLEKLITQIGAIQVITGIFTEISPSYDAGLQRYHLVPRLSALGGGTPQIPWGYLLQLAVKHVNADFPAGLRGFDSYWPVLLKLSTAYAAVVDVQPYYPAALRTFDVRSLLDFFASRHCMTRCSDFRNCGLQTS